MSVLRQFSARPAPKNAGSVDRAAIHPPIRRPLQDHTLRPSPTKRNVHKPLPLTSIANRAAEIRGDASPHVCCVGHAPPGFFSSVTAITDIVVNPSYRGRTSQPRLGTLGSVPNVPQTSQDGENYLQSPPGGPETGDEALSSTMNVAHSDSCPRSRSLLRRT